MPLLRSVAEDIDVMARTIFGEIRGYSYLDQLAVGWVIRNRADKPSWWGKDVKDVCLKPRQFSCWNEGDPNLDRLKATNLESFAFRSCFRAALAAYDRAEPDPTGGATHYHTLDKPPEAVTWPPSWAAMMIPTRVVGPHTFYKEA